MSYNVVTQEGVRTFENIDDAGDYAQAMSLRTGEPAKVFHAKTGLVAFTVRPTTKDTKWNQFQQQGWRFRHQSRKRRGKNPAQNVGGRHLQSHHRFFDGEVQEMKAAKE